MNVIVTEPNINFIKLSFIDSDGDIKDYWLKNSLKRSKIKQLIDGINSYQELTVDFESLGIKYEFIIEGNQNSKLIIKMYVMGNKIISSHSIKINENLFNALNKLASLLH
jgi:hypothetical protein